MNTLRGFYRKNWVSLWFTLSFTCPFVHLLISLLLISLVIFHTIHRSNNLLYSSEQLRPKKTSRDRWMHTMVTTKNFTNTKHRSFFARQKLKQELNETNFERATGSKAIAALETNKQIRIEYPTNVGYSRTYTNRSCWLASSEQQHSTDMCVTAEWLVRTFTYNPWLLKTPASLLPRVQFAVNCWRVRATLLSFFFACYHR